MCLRGGEVIRVIWSLWGSERAVAEREELIDFDGSINFGEEVVRRVETNGARHEEERQSDQRAAN